MNKGKVFLVGAGPGDHRLLTYKGWEILQKADIVLYDRLVNPSLISLIPPSVEKLYVGKAPGNHSYSQAEINDLIINNADKGKTVVRLKGGDPFIFGRGGEEAVELAENNIDYEIIPGITSVIGVPSYAGIPVTHRGKSSSFHVFTGHSVDTLNFENIANLEGTLIFVMGLRNLSDITKNLLEQGVSPHKKAAVIRYGTTSDQQLVKGQLENIADRVENNHLTPPAIIVIGQVVGLQEKINWFNNNSLSGKRIMVTRPYEQQQQLGRLIEKKGGEVLYYPTIKIEGPIVNDEVLNCVKSIEKYDWIFLTSPNGVKYLFEIFKKTNIDLRELSSVKFAVIGPGTRSALKNQGIIADFMPEKYTTDFLGREFINLNELNQKILLPRSNLAEKKLIKKLQENGHQPKNIYIYKTCKTEGNDENLLSHLEERSLDLITFTSPSTVSFLAEKMGVKVDKIRNIPAVCIGPVTAGAAEDYGFNVIRKAEDHTIPGLMEVIEECFAAN